MSPAASSRADKGPISILQLHGRFEDGAKDRRMVRLMNRWGSRACHDLMIAQADAEGAKAGLDASVSVRFLGERLLGAQGGPGRFVALAQLMRGYDLVLSFGWGAIDGVVTQRLLGLLMGLPPLVHHEDGSALKAVGPLGFGSDLYRRYSLSAARALVVPTGSLAHLAIASWGESAAHVKQIPDGIDVAAYAGGRPRGAVAGLGDDHRLVIGARVEDASPPMLDQLLRAMAPLQDKARLVLLDAPGEDAVLAERAAAFGIADLLAPASLPPPQDYLGALDLFVLLAQAEPAPLTLTEAMAAGLAVVATETGDVADMLAPANRPFAVRPGDDAALAKALARLVEDAALRAELGAANHRRATQCFDESVTFDLYGRLYGGAVGRDDALL